MKKDIRKNSVKIGKNKVELALKDMPGLKNIQNLFNKNKPFEKINILGCVTPTPETGAFILTLRQLGANLRWCSDNIIGSDNEVVAYLNSLNIPIFAKRNMSLKEYYINMEKALDFKDKNQNIQIIDDGSDITKFIFENHPKFLEKVKGITEQTTCGINYLKKLYKKKVLTVPTININDCFIKKNFDNYYGIKESIVYSLIKTTNMQIASKKIAIIGYGSVGRGAAMALSSLGARICVVEFDILKATQAHFDGFEVLDLNAALRESQICLTATGCIDVIKGKDIENAREGIILGNIGHGNQEYDINYLENHGNKYEINEYLDLYILKSGKKIYSLCKGSLVNIIAGGGNKSSVMSLTFTLQILGQLEFINNYKRYSEPKMHSLDISSERICAELNFPEFKKKIYRLNKKQKEYLNFMD